MLTREEEVEVFALRKRGWSKSAIARHLNRDRKTIAKYLRGDSQPGIRKKPDDWFAKYVPYIAARFDDDRHLWTTVLYRELVALRFPASYQTLTREIRARNLRPECKQCRAARGDVATIEIDHDPGAETQFDWLHFEHTPWAEPAYVLVGALSYSSKCRGVVSDGQSAGHVIESLDGVLRRLDGTTQRWRTDRMAGVVVPGTDRLTPLFADVAKYYGVAVDICPPRRAKRKGVVEAANKYIANGWWRAADIATPADAQATLDDFCAVVADHRPREDRTVADLATEERLQPLPATPYPAVIEVSAPVSPSALVAFDGNAYSVPPELIGSEVTVRTALRAGQIEIVSAAGVVVAVHARAPKGRREVVRSDDHRAALEAVVLGAFTTDKPCRRKANRPPGDAAKAAAVALVGDATASGGDVIDLKSYERLAKEMR